MDLSHYLSLVVQVKTIPEKEKEKFGNGRIAFSISLTSISNLTSEEVVPVFFI